MISWIENRLFPVRFRCGLIGRPWGPVGAWPDKGGDFDDPEMASRPGSTDGLGYAVTASPSWFSLPAPTVGVTVHDKANVVVSIHGLGEWR